MAFVEIGVIYDLIPAEIEGDEPTFVALEGWHVDSLEPLEGAEPFLVTPTTASHGFAGVPDSQVYRYKFENKYQAKNFIKDSVI